jgi:hypothetical protein
MSAKGVKNMSTFIHSFVVLPVHQSGIKLFPKSQIHIITEMGNRWHLSLTFKPR